MLWADAVWEVTRWSLGTGWFVDAPSNPSATVLLLMGTGISITVLIVFPQQRILSGYRSFSPLDLTAEISVSWKWNKLTEEDSLCSSIFSGSKENLPSLIEILLTVQYNEGNVITKRYWGKSLGILSMRPNILASCITEGWSDVPRTSWLQSCPCNYKERHFWTISSILQLAQFSSKSQNNFSKACWSSSLWGQLAFMQHASLIQTTWNSIQRCSQVTVMKSSPKVGKALLIKCTTFLQMQMRKKGAAVERVKYLI